MSKTDLTKKIFKTFPIVETKAVEGAPRTLVVKISTSAPDRAKDVVMPNGMDSNNFMKNPVVLFAHNYSDLPIAKAKELKVTDDAILATVEFPQEGLYSKADVVYQMYKKGFLNAWSVGFMPTGEDGYEENDLGGYTFKQWELLEFSSVPVPANAEALTVMRSKGIDTSPLFEKGVIGYKKTPLADEGESWDGPGEMAKCDVAGLKAICTWFDSENADNKGAYKLPHHKGDGEHACVWKGVAAAMGALLGARGGTKIPDSDRKGVYNHLAKHYADFKKEAPDFKSYSNEVIEKIIAGTFKKAEDDETEPYTDATKVTELTVGDLKDIVEDVVESCMEGQDTDEGKNANITIEKVGRTISAKHEGLLAEAMQHCQAIMQNVQTVLDSVAEEDDDGKSLKPTPSIVNSLYRALKKQDKDIGLALRELKFLKKREGVKK